MLKEQSRLLAAATFAVDLALVAAAFVLAHVARAELLPLLFPELFPGPFYSLQTYLPLMPVVLAIWAAFLLRSDSYRSHRTVPLLEEAREIFKSCALALMALALLIYGLRLEQWLLGTDEISRPWMLLVGLFSCLLLLTEKLALRTLSRYVRASGFNYRTVVIVGNGRGAVELADSIRNHRYWGFKVLGFIEHPPGQDAPVPPTYQNLGTIEALQGIVTNKVVDDVLFCVGRRELDRLEDLILGLHEQGIRTQFALEIFPHARAQTRLEDWDGVPILTISTAPERLLPLLFKRVLDILLSVTLMLLSLPVMLGICLLIKLTEGGQVLYRQTRCGLNGRRFVMYKFRTMVADADLRREELLHLNEMSGPVFKLASDPRVTFLGRILRRFSLDELPQFWNVLRGDMSLVGPRPPIPEEVDQYQRWQRRRLSMKPGLTCLWQISGRNELDFDQWMQLDLQYIDSWSPWLDLKILAKTVPAVLSGRGAS
jgi:exopolysaccharide biosynthesis polyprenyl glycosylphosphotransferase